MILTLLAINLGLAALQLWNTVRLVRRTRQLEDLIADLEELEALCAA